MNLKKNWYLAGLICLTAILGIAAVVTAWKLYQAGKKPVAPTAPESRPAAVAPECVLEFDIPEPTPTPGTSPTPSLTPTPGPSPTPTPTPTITPTPTTGPSPTPTQTPTPSPTSAPGPTSTPAPTTTPTPIPELPEAGGIAGTTFIILGGLVLTLLGILL